MTFCCSPRSQCRWTSMGWCVVRAWCESEPWWQSFGCTGSWTGLHRSSPVVRFLCFHYECFCYWVWEWVTEMGDVPEIIKFWRYWAINTEGWNPDEHRQISNRLKQRQITIRFNFLLDNCFKTVYWPQSSIWDEINIIVSQCHCHVGHTNMDFFIVYGFSHRNITAVAQHGLECQFFISHCLSVSPKASAVLMV